MESTTPLITPDDHSAGRRAREVYRFFRPERPVPDEDALYPRKIDHDVSGSPHSCTSKTSQCSNPSTLDSMIIGDSSSTLNSFAQLAALRLGVDRVFISVSDRDSQFILAQAAQTSENDSKYDSLSDGIYSGPSTLDTRTWTMCKDTIALPPSARTKVHHNFIISNDLSQDDRYKHLPLVQEDPKFRFYAGTPLTSDSNINLGCFFALDTKPHPEFTNIEKETMGHIALLVMDFLKVSRQACEGRRASRLSLGLNYFVEGCAAFSVPPQSQDLEKWVLDASYASGPLNEQSVSSVTRKACSQTQDRLSIGDASPMRSESRDKSTHSVNSFSDVSGPTSCDAAYKAEWDRVRTGDVKGTKGNSWTFRRAANLIRESLELHGDDGVVFVEAGRDDGSNSGSDSDISTSSNSTDNPKPASILAISTEENPYGQEKKSSISSTLQNMDEEFMRRLLRRYHKKGNIWSFHRDRMFSSSDSEDLPRQSRGRTRPSSLRAKKAQKWKLRENLTLNACFPGATQVLFVPLWNAANAQFLGGFFCWNSVESVVLSPTVELSSLMGFGTSVMAEYNRIESLISDRQKADFLGSISHELRSPLHGILAATEFLQKSELTNYQVTLMETIDACGRTLLDTMNQVLDFSKIVSNEKQLRRSKSKKKVSPDGKESCHRSASHLDKHKPTDVSVLTEEVVEGLCLGHFHGQLTTSSGYLQRDSDAEKTAQESTPLVDVDVDISSNDWVYHTAPGALRRIVMNVVSNALKYTSEGRIFVQLRAKESPETDDTDIVTLTVSDTGKGISEEFLRNGLYTPFVQEDSLVSGSGLGLSIVRSLIRSLGGTINIQSQVGKGTTVKVILPLMRPVSDDSDDTSEHGPPCSLLDENLSHTTDKTISGLNVAILGVEPEEAASNPTWKDMSRYLTDWHGMNLVSANSDTPLDVLMADKMPSRSDIDRKITTNPAVIVFSRGWIGNLVMRVQSPFGNKLVHTINRPCGPHKLRRSIQKSLKQPPSESSMRTLPERTRNQTSTGERTINTSPPSPPPSDSDSLRSDSSIKREARILVVEDNKINLNLMLTFLNQRKPSTLDSAENGQMAVTAVEEEKTGYDIIFMDISMPIMTGIEATRAIRAIERKRGDRKPATIIALTGLSNPSDKFEALDSGMDMFLTKPVAFKNIRKILDGWVETESQAENAIDLD